MRAWALRVGLTLLLIVAGWRAFHRLVALRVAEVFPTIAGLQQALAWDPSEPRLHFQLGLDSRDLVESRDLEQARRSLERAAQLNPWAWRYRMELARLYEMLGDDERAEREWLAACARNPIGATYHWRLGNFYLRQGPLERALPSLARALDLKPALFATTALLVVKAGATGPQLDRLLPDDRPSRHRLLQFLVAQWRDTDGREPATALIDGEWQGWMASAEPPVPAEGAFYVSHLLRRGSFAAARQVWIELQGESAGAPPDYRRGRNYVWNPGFDGRPSGTELDWSLRSEGAVTARLAAGAGRDGSSALEIALRGADDRELRGLRQWVVTGPERAYRVSFDVRWENVTSEVFLEAADAEGGRSLWRSEGFAGSGGWRPVTGSFARSEPGESIVLRWRGERSAGPVSGTLWLDDVVLGGQPGL